MQQFKEYKGMEVNYTTFLTDQEYVMDSKCKDLKDPNFAPYHLRIRECKNRFMKGYGEFYMEIAERIQTDLIKIMLDEHGNLTTEYKSNQHTSNSGTNTPSGTVDEFGNLWCPYFRVSVPQEQYDILQPLGVLKGRWNNSTLIIGKKATDNVAENIRLTRTNGLSNGYAEELIDKVNDEFNTFIPYSIKHKLTQGYESR